MREIKKGDAVTRISYGNDIIFYVKTIIKVKEQKKIAILKGINARIEADAPIEDLVYVTKEQTNRCEKQLKERINQKIKLKVEDDTRTKKIIYTGKILHLDGDASLQKCNYMSADIL